MIMKTKKEIRIDNAMLLFNKSELSNKDFAEKIGVAATYWGSVKKGKGIGDQIAMRIEQSFEMEKGWMDHEHAADGSEAISNTAPADIHEDEVPLISSVKAGRWSEAIDIYEPGYADGWERRIKGGSGEHVYALRVDGDSMTAPAGASPSFPNGYIIHVDPDQPPENGDCVIAKVKGYSEVTFKQLKFESGRPYLKPLNPSHPPIFDEFEVIGRVIGAYFHL